MKMKMVLPHTPEGAEALSPGQRPGLLRMIAYQISPLEKVNFTKTYF